MTAPKAPAPSDRIFARAEADMAQAIALDPAYPHAYFGVASYGDGRFVQGGGR